MLYRFNELFSVDAQNPVPQGTIHACFKHTIHSKSLEGMPPLDRDPPEGPGVYFMFRKQGKCFRLIYVGKHATKAPFHGDRVRKHFRTITFKFRHAMTLGVRGINATTTDEIDAAFLHRFTFKGCKNNELWNLVRRNLLQLPHRVDGGYPPPDTLLGTLTEHVAGSGDETAPRRFQYACLYWREVKCLSQPKQLQDYLDANYSFLWLKTNLTGTDLGDGETRLIEKYFPVVNDEIGKKSYRRVVNDEMGKKKYRRVVNNCCRPRPGRPIVGEFSSESDMVIHTDVCNKVADIRDNPEKCVSVRWEEDEEVEVERMMSSSEDVNRWANEELLLNEIPKFRKILNGAA